MTCAPNSLSHRIDETVLAPKRTQRRTFRSRIFLAWDHRCAYCTACADTLDHLLPRSAGGLTVAENLVPACKRCNGRKGSLLWREWFEAQEWFDLQRAERIAAWISGGSLLWLPV